MTAFNVVRFRVKPGKENEFVALNRSFGRIDGMRRASLIKTGERSFCLLGEWGSFEAIVAGRPKMIANLDRLRPLLEDLGGGLGVTDPVSGEVVVEL